MIGIREQAKFIGVDGSLGLRKGNVYNISLVKQTKYPLMIKIEGYGICPYSTIVDFLGNWEMILPKKQFISLTKQCEPVNPFVNTNTKSNNKFIHV